MSRCCSSIRNELFSLLVGVCLLLLSCSFHLLIYLQFYYRSLPILLVSNERVVSLTTASVSIFHSHLATFKLILLLERDESL